MRKSTCFIALSIVFALAGCDRLRNYRRTAERDIETAINIEQSARPGNPSVIFESIRKALGCTKVDSRYITASAECRGRDGLAVTSLSLDATPRRFSINVQTLDAAAPRTADIARRKLGLPIGYADDLAPAWKLPSGVLIARDRLLVLLHPESGDIHDVIDVAAQPQLPKAAEALARIYRAIERRNGYRGVQMTPAKLVALSVERMQLPDEACVGDLLLDGNEVCMGRGVSSSNTNVLTQVHASITARPGYELDVTTATWLLGQVVGGRTQSVLDAQLKAQRGAAFSVVRDMNFALISIRQQFPDEPLAFHHLIVMRRTLLSTEDENTMRDNANRPPPKLDFDAELTRELMAEEAKQQRRVPH